MTIKLLYILLTATVAFVACGGNADEDNAKNKKKSKPFVMKETIAKGADTNMVRFASVRRANVLDIICQHWELMDNNDADEKLVIDKDGQNVFPELNLFNDSTYTENPRSHFDIGTWQIKYKNENPVLVLHPLEKKERYYIISGMTSTTLNLVVISAKGKPQSLNLMSDGQSHQNKYNDPFYTANNQWRIKPSQPENDIQIAARVKGCVKFFALYYRDNLKRGKGDISFLGLPDIFVWYHRGIGLPDKDEVNQSWLNCFYNKEQALRGYDILRDLIVRYEFDWPAKAPDWRYESHSVLEQMYHKMK